jgi:hypothetical protein
LLFTYDRAWYETARQQLDGWRRYELFTVQVGDHERPMVKGDTDHLSRALDFLLAGDVKAAAAHVRTQFEEVLKAGCVQLGVKVPYATNPRTVRANDLWSCLQAHPVAKLPPPKAFTKEGVTYIIRPSPRGDHVVDNDLRRCITHALSWVLNPLIHSESVERYRVEIEQAIFAVSDLEGAIHDVNAQQEIVLQIERSVLLQLLLDRVRHETAKQEEIRTQEGAAA